VSKPLRNQQKSGIIVASKDAGVDRAMGYITGANRDQIVLLPDSVDEYVTEENVVRVIDAYVDGLHMESLGFSKAEPCETGRPPYSPQDLLKLYIYGYMNRIRSSRRLEVETNRNLEVIWLLRKLMPDHKTIARFRHDNASALKNVFRNFVQLCMGLGLYGRELAAIDGSKFKAVNSTDRNLSVKELNERIKRLSARIDEYMQQMNETDVAEAAEADGDNVVTAGGVKQIIDRLSNRKNTYESYLEELAASGETQKSLTDSDARLMKDAKGFDVSYNVQTSVDSKNKLIAEFAVTNQANDLNQLANMATATAEILKTPDIMVVADTGYNSASEIAECITNGIIPQVAGADGDICVSCDASEAGDIVSHENGRGVYLKDRNVVICPMGKIMYPGCYKNCEKSARFYNGHACAVCKCRCTDSKYRVFDIRMKKSAFSKNHNDENLHIRQVHLNTDSGIIRKRKEIVEHPFGTIKRGMFADHLLMKSIPKVTGEFSLVFLAYNIKRVINIMGAKSLIEALS